MHPCWFWEGNYHAVAGEKGWAKWGKSGHLQCGEEEAQQSRTGTPMLRESVVMGMFCIGFEVILAVIKCCLLSMQQLCCVL